MANGARFTIGLDTGGTFVDCVAVAADGRLIAEKALATPDDPTQGVLEALANTASALSLSVETLLESTTSLVHGTTIGLNTLFTRTGTQVGLLATRGHEDALLIGRVHQKVAGLSPDQITRAFALEKPVPLVPRWLIHGIHERIDYAGDEIVPLDEAGVATAARELVAEGCQALAICFLWSFKNSTHEHRAYEIIRQQHPELAVSLSSEVAPVLGEYERTATTVVNAYIGQRFRDYLESLAHELETRGLKNTPYVMLSSGGGQPARAAAERAVETLGSGPVGGVVAAQTLGNSLNLQNLVTTDVGGTSFDVGLIVDGVPIQARMPIFERLHLAVPAVDVRSIGAGGGSIASVDERGKLHVGPESAGAEPGPACYGRGGTEPTVTDADLLLGRLNPDTLLGGRLHLDRAAAERAIGGLAARLGMDIIDSANGIVRVIDAQMADLVRKVSVERGHDPRRFVLVAYGGAAPLHVGAYGPDVGVPEAVISPLAPVFSAFGLALSDWHRVYVRSDPMRLPADPARLGAIFEELERTAREDYAQAGRDSTLSLERSVDLRFRRQTHEVGVVLPGGPIDESVMSQLAERFEVEYERIFGQGAAYSQAGIEASTFRVVANAKRVERETDADSLEDPDPATGLVGYRAAFFTQWVDQTPVYAGERLRPGHRIIGPALVDSRATTLVIHPGQEAHVDGYRNVHLVFGAP